MDSIDNSVSTEERILAAAEREFMLKGFAATRTTAIAQAAGVTHAMLHYYFRSKENLFSRVIADKLSVIARTFLIPIDNDTPLVECIRRAVESHFDFVRANPALPRFMISEVFTNDRLLDLLQNKIDGIAGNTVASLQAKIDREADRGACRRVSAHSLMMDVISLNVFPIVAMPMAERVNKALKAMSVDQFLDARREDNVQTILRKLQL